MFVAVSGHRRTTGAPRIDIPEKERRRAEVNAINAEENMVNCKRGRSKGERNTKEEWKKNEVSGPEGFSL
jgi:hypothetical protein